MSTPQLPRRWRPVRLTVLGRDRYELEAMDEDGQTLITVCTVVETPVSGRTIITIEADPNFFTRNSTDQRPIYRAVRALHEACNAADTAPLRE